MANRTYRYFDGKPLYPFGHGLSYTKFKYGKLRVADQGDHTLRVTVDVTNTGKRDGDEVVQIYATPPAAREREALCGFARVALAKGETKTVTINVPANELRRWSAEKKDYVVPRGTWRIAAGASSEDLREKEKIKID